MLLSTEGKVEIVNPVVVHQGIVAKIITIKEGEVDQKSDLIIQMLQLCPRKYHSKDAAVPKMLLHRKIEKCGMYPLEFLFIQTQNPFVSLLKEEKNY